MGGFAADTAVEGGEGRYRAALSAEWAVWGPMGGTVAAIALRAMAAASALPRPASFACQFLAFGRFAPVEIEVTPLQVAKRAEAWRALVVQEGRPILSASAWFVDDALAGYEHEGTRPPAVAGPEGVPGFQDRADNYADWYPFWRNVEGRPLRWSDEPEPADPLWHCWMRLRAPLRETSPSLDAARSLLWLDLMMWNAACAPHVWPRRFIAPNLDLTAQFHATASAAEWLLCDSASPRAGAGLMACNGRVWAPGGTLVASGTSHLLCRPNPGYPEELERHRAWLLERRRAKG
jgi:acyl-CoA thioesterase